MLTLVRYFWLKVRNLDLSCYFKLKVRKSDLGLRFSTRSQKCWLGVEILTWSQECWLRVEIINLKSGMLTGSCDFLLEVRNLLGDEIQKCWLGVEILNSNHNYPGQIHARRRRFQEINWATSRPQMQLPQMQLLYRLVWLIWPMTTKLWQNLVLDIMFWSWLKSGDFEKGQIVENASIPHLFVLPNGSVRLGAFKKNYQYPPLSY